MSNERQRREALVYHAKPRPGKIGIIPTKKYSSQRDLSLAYSPGVAEPCKEIDSNVDNVYKYTNKKNLVAVISNGTAVLGLGDIGPEASKPVMEGKGLLFKIFSDVDVFDIEVDAENVDNFVETVKNIAPTFGGINLEDLKAPEAFEIERRLKKELDIPVMHDDQHGTAIISAAAFLNALELADKAVEEVKVVVSGAGSAALACAELYVLLGVKRENMVLFDSKGSIHSGRTDISERQKKFAIDQKYDSLAAAMKGADAFLGLSVGNLVSQDMLKSMNADPIVFAMANPDPEIDYQSAVDARDDVIMATGRSDNPNQVNNVLGFPFIFRGALDVRAKEINEEMKMATVKALADLAKKPVPEQVNIAYGETKLNFGRDYIIPKPFDSRLMTEVPPAVAKAAMDSGVADEPITDWKRYEDELYERIGTDNKITRLMNNRARMNPKKVVFAEADHLDVLKAAQISIEEGIAQPVLLGNREVILELMIEIEFDGDSVSIIDPKSNEQTALVEKYAELLWRARERKGMTKYDALNLMRSRNYFASMMVNEGDADALLTGYSRAYPTAVKPLLDLIGTARGVDRVAATNLMNTARGPIFISDTSINFEPTADELARIAQMTAKTIEMFGLEPSMAMISYANFGSSKNPNAKKVKEAVSYLHKNFPDIQVDGEVQVDFALNREMLRDKFPFSKIAGQKINALIYPNLSSANSTYKLIKELNDADSIGPIMMGLKKPAHVFQLGASVEEMVNMTAFAVVDAQEKEKGDQRPHSY